MTTKHTPDTPWRTFKGVEDEPDRWTVVTDYGYHIATIENGAPGDCCDTEEANARRIAAAPDLLAALENLLPIAAKLIDESYDMGHTDYPSGNISEVIRAQAAIGRVYGQNDAVMPCEASASTPCSPS